MTKPTYTGPPHPIGYVELQGAYTGPFDSDKGLELFAELMTRAASECPGLVVHSHRWETVRDGAGLAHHHLYMGFAPKHVAAEPLNPNNMNDTPAPAAGDPGPADGIMPLGWKEQQFGRGT